MDQDLREKVDMLASNFKETAAYKYTGINAYTALDHALEKHAHTKDTQVLISVLDRIGGVRSANEINAGALEGIAIHTLTNFVNSGVVRKIVDTNSPSAANVIVQSTMQQALGILSENQINQVFVNDHQK